MCSVYLFLVCKKIKELQSNSDMKYLQDIKILKTKSYDLSDVTLVLTNKLHTLQTDVNILKHKLYCYDKDIDDLSKQICKIATEHK